MPHLVHPADRHADDILSLKKLDLTKTNYDLVALAQGFQELVAVLHAELTGYFFVVSLDEGGAELVHESGGTKFTTFLNSRNCDLVSHHYYNGEGDHAFGKAKAYEEAVASMARYATVARL